MQGNESEKEKSGGRMRCLPAVLAVRGRQTSGNVLAALPVDDGVAAILYEGEREEKGGKRGER